MNPIQQALQLVNQRRAALQLAPACLDQRLVRGARYWLALCQGRDRWRTEFADQEPWNAITSAPLEFELTWLLVTTTPASVEASVEQWFRTGKQHAALTDLSHIGLALEQNHNNWHWVIYTANPVARKQIWW